MDHDQFKLLQMFPEYNSSLEFIQTGEFSKALPLLNRVDEILTQISESSNGNENYSILKNFLAFKTAYIFRYQGEHKKAESLLQSHISSCQSLSPSHWRRQCLVSSHQILASCEILSINGNADKALSSAKAAVDLCESIPKEEEAMCEEEGESDLAMMSDSYSLQGLAHLVEGDMDSAEVFLQLGARWARTPLQRMASLTNLGS
jgi:hypothetical protein